MTTPTPRGRQSLRDLLSSNGNTPIGDTTFTGVSLYTHESSRASHILTQIQRLPTNLVTPRHHDATPTPTQTPSRSRRTPRSRISGIPSTPYGIRAMQQRAANTPGRDRRRSGRVQRENLFDILKSLGRGKRKG